MRADARAQGAGLGCQALAGSTSRGTARQPGGSCLPPAAPAAFGSGAALALRSALTAPARDAARSTAPLQECHCMLFLTEDNDFAGSDQAITLDEVVEHTKGM